MNAPYRVRLATAEDLLSWQEHLAEHMAENGHQVPYFAPFTAAQSALRFAPSAERAARTLAEMARGVDEPDWLRVFVAEEGGAMVGHADLHGGSIGSEMHRCRLGLGVLARHHRRGLGEALLREAIGWARGAGLAWMDLGVFGENLPAIALYCKLGFVETGRVVDRFRLGAARLDDISMSLDLRG
jgi:GNAT superfamily N-acetyltransferase